MIHHTLELHQQAQERVHAIIQESMVAHGIESFPSQFLSDGDDPELRQKLERLSQDLKQDLQEVQVKKYKLAMTIEQKRDDLFRIPIEAEINAILSSSEGLRGAVRQLKSLLDQNLDAFAPPS